MSSGQAQLPAHSYNFDLRVAPYSHCPVWYVTRHKRGRVAFGIWLRRQWAIQFCSAGKADVLMPFRLIPFVHTKDCLAVGILSGAGTAATVALWCLMACMVVGVVCRNVLSLVFCGLVGRAQFSCLCLL